MFLLDSCSNKDSRITQSSLEPDAALLTSGEASDPSTLGYDGMPSWMNADAGISCSTSDQPKDGVSNNQPPKDSDTGGPSSHQTEGRCDQGFASTENGGRFVQTSNFGLTTKFAFGTRF